MTNLQRSLHSSLSFLSILLLCFCAGPEPLMAKEEVILIPIGVILDFKSSFGIMAETCLSMALEDFYKQNAHYKTRLSLLKRDSKNDVVTAACAASDLIKNENVHAIVGPQTSDQARFVIELGSEAQVPIISFSATSPSLSPNRNPYFIRTALDDCSQVEAIAAMVEAYGWHEITLIYEDAEYGNGLIPCLNDAFVKISTRVLYRGAIDPNSEEPKIRKELNKLKDMHKSIFLVHMTAHLASKFFLAAMNAGMISEGYAWLVTQGLSSELDPMGPDVVESMQGVLGVRPMVPKTIQLEEFNNRRNKSPAVTLFGLWAYDTVQALAMAVENAAKEKSNSTLRKNFFTCNTNADLPDLNLYVSGTRLLNKILAINFKGLSGDFKLAKGQLEPSTLQIFNVIGYTERILGYWIRGPKGGLFRDLIEVGKSSKFTQKLKPPIWPGDPPEQPTKLRIGVPFRKEGFHEFLKVEGSSLNGTERFTGFAIDMFLEVVKVLPFPFPYEFIPFVKDNGVANGTYDQLVAQLKAKKFDAAVGDITIVVNRTKYADFTLPYSESGVSMVVRMKHDERQSMWIFLKPLSLGLWLTTGAGFVFTGFIIWLLEHRKNNDFQGPPQPQLGKILWFSFSRLVFGHKEKVVNSWPGFVTIMWLFVVLIITHSYTASLASMLTVPSLQPAFNDVAELRRNGYLVGYQDESFVKSLLTDRLGFEQTQLKAFGTPEEFDEALFNGEVAAIFDEIPYLKVFIAKYGSKYKMVGPTYQTGGFGFAFPLKSPLVSYFSRAILKVTEDKDTFEGITNKYFSSRSISEDQSASFPSESPRLTVYSFGGLFMITFVTSFLSLLYYVCEFLCSHGPTLRTVYSDQRSLWAVLTEMATHFDREDSSLRTANRNNSTVHPAPNSAIDAATPNVDDGTDNSTQNHNETDNVTLNEDHDIHALTY